MYGSTLCAGSCPPSQGLGPLGHLNLELGSVAQIINSHAKTPARHLLDGAVANFAPGVGFIAGFIFPPFPGIAFGSYLFIAMAMVSWASGLREPKDMAPETKRRKMESTLSTSSRGIASAGANSNRPRRVQRCCACRLL